MSIMSQRIQSDDEILEIKIERWRGTLINAIRNALFYGARNFDGLAEALHELHKLTLRRQSDYTYDSINKIIAKRAPKTERILELIKKDSLTEPEQKELKRLSKALQLRANDKPEIIKVYSRWDEIKETQSNKSYIDEVNKGCVKSELEVDGWYATASGATLEEYRNNRGLYATGYIFDNKYNLLMRDYDKWHDALDKLKDLRIELNKIEKMPICREPYEPDYYSEPEKITAGYHHRIPEDKPIVSPGMPGFIGGNGNGEASGL